MHFSLALGSVFDILGLSNDGVTAAAGPHASLLMLIAGCACSYVYLPKLAMARNPLTCFGVTLVHVVSKRTSWFKNL